MNASLVSLEDFKRIYFKDYQQLLVDEFGFFFDEARAAQLRNVLLSRIEKNNHKSFENYLGILKNTSQGKAEIDKLVTEITIGETFFFRNLPQLDMLRNELLPHLVNRKRLLGVNDIKIWSAGCSTGEEVYTLAMILMEEVPGASLWNISILGTDINKAVLDVAQKGQYSSRRTMKDIPPDYMDKYFVRIGNSYIVNDQLKKITRFEHHNLVRDEYNLPEMVDLDIIFCRNVTIYFNIDTTKGVINRMYDALTDQGYLIIGHSETLWQINNKFTTLDFPHAFAYQKDLSRDLSKKKEEAPSISLPELNLEDISVLSFKKGSRSPMETLPVEDFSIKMEDIPREREKPSGFEETHGEDIPAVTSFEEFYNLQFIDKNYHEATLAFQKKKYDEALQKFSEIIEKDDTYILAYFGKATIYANQGEYDSAIEELLHIVDFNNLFLEAYYLLGVLYDKKKDIDKAIQMFEKVIYIDHSIVLAYYHLGNLYRYKGSSIKSLLQYNNIRNALKDKDESDIVRFSDNMTNKMLMQLIDKLSQPSVKSAKVR
jgi:chemotaxis protein methyltransferase CheR